MKIVVIGGTGLIGSKLVNKLRQHGHESVPAAPNTGINTITGEGLARIAVGSPLNAIAEIAGPEQFRVDELVRRRLASLKDPREVIADPNARYGGAKVSEKTLLPGNNARLGETRFETWLTLSAAQIPRAA